MRNEEENRQIQQLIPTEDVTYMGLFKDAFVWSDNSMSSFRNWESSQPDGSGDCVVHSRQSRLWDDQECSDARPFFCYDSECLSMSNVLWPELGRLNCRLLLFTNDMIKNCSH